MTLNTAGWTVGTGPDDVDVHLDHGKTAALATGNYGGVVTAVSAWLWPGIAAVERARASGFSSLLPGAFARREEGWTAPLHVEVRAVPYSTSPNRGTRP
jgi:hypothetical protein